MTPLDQPSHDFLAVALTDEPDRPISVGGWMSKVIARQKHEILPELAAVGRLIDLRRREQGLSLDELRLRANVSADALDDLNHGLRMPTTVDVIRQLAGILQLPGEKLIDAAGLNGSTGCDLSSAAIRYADLARPSELTPHERQALHGFMGALTAV